MRAWRIYGDNDIRLDDVSVPEVKDRWVVLKVRMFQLSVTEIQMLNGKSVAEGGRNLDWSENNPLQRLGHEFCAQIVELGKGVPENLKIGDRVFWGNKSTCGECLHCVSGFEEFCPNGPSIGVDIPGCLSEFCILPANCLLKVPESITDSEVAAMQSLEGALRFVLAAEIEPGDTIAIFGQGVMGSYCAQLSRARGAGRIIGVDIRDEALNVAKQLGFNTLINASKENPEEVISEITNGIGPDVVFDCASGSTEVGLSGKKTLTQSLNVVRKGGTLVPVSILDPDAMIEYAPIYWKSVQYKPGRPNTLKEKNWMIDLVSSKTVQLEPLVTHVLEGLDKLPKALEITSNKIENKAINPAQVIVNNEP